MTDYERSKSLSEIPNLSKLPAKFKNDIVNSRYDSPEYREVVGQYVIDAICNTLNIPIIKLHVREKPQLHHNNSNGRLRNKTLGRYWHSGDCGIDIEIWNLTAKRRKRITNKVFFGVLCHEICHHVDCALLKIESSPHTSGFYQRISCIEHCFD